MSINGVNGSHYREINHHYAEECSQDDIGSFLFTSESVGEGHPGTVIVLFLAKVSKEPALVTAILRAMPIVYAASTWFCLQPVRDSALNSPLIHSLLIVKNASILFPLFFLSSEQSRGAFYRA